MTDQGSNVLSAEPAGEDAGEQAFTDPHRPRFHFVAPSGWLNDPNGLVQWKGRFHMFYQHNPHQAVHTDVHWGHASSDDLIHWRDEPVALAPDPDGPDRDGCWSGVLVDDDGVPTIVYSGNHHGVGQRTCLAVGDSELRTWRKGASNPIIADLPAGLDLLEYRDHCVWREQGEWRQLVGSGIRDQGGTALLYRSPDLRSWEYLGPLLVGDARRRDPVWTGSVWECIDLFQLGEEGVAAPDVLLGSAWHAGETRHPFAFTGRYTGKSFEVVHEQLLDFGLGSFYAPQSMRDDSGRRIVFGWMQEGRPDDAVRAAGWGGVMSLPRVATLDIDGTVLLAPALEVDILRREHDGVGACTLPHGRTAPVAAGDQLDLELTLHLPVGGLVHLDLRTSPDGQERTTVTLDGAAGDGTAGLVLDRSVSSLDPTLDAGMRSGTVRIGPDRRIDLRVVVDHSAIETFVNGRPLSTRVYPTREDALEVRLRAERADVRVETLDVWRMASVWTRPRRVLRTGDVVEWVPPGDRVGAPDTEL